MVKFQKIYWISQKCFHCYGMVGFKRPYFKSEILTKSQPITIMRRWATRNQTQSTFQSLPVQNNKDFTLNRALTSHMVKTGGWDGIGKRCTFLGRSGDRKGIGGNFHLKRFSVNLQEMPFGTPGSNWLPARTNWQESKEGKLALEWWGGEMWGTLTIWFYMLRLFRLFIDISTTGSFHLLCKEDVRELGQGFERQSIRDSQFLWGQDLPRMKRLFLLAGDNLTKTLISSFPQFGQPKHKGWKQGL